MASSIYALKTNKFANSPKSPASLLSDLEFMQLVKGTVLVSATSSKNRRSTVQKEELMKVWGIIRLEAAERTLQAMTQLVVRNALHPIQRHFRTEVAQLRYNCLSGRHGRFYSDTMFGPKSLRQNSMC
jgi:hypothetical protein